MAIVREFLFTNALCAKN